jgi:hypothetical protein
MLDDCTYNKVKLLHEFSEQLWFIQKHALNDAKVVCDDRCINLLMDIERDLQKHIEQLHKEIKR